MRNQKRSAMRGFTLIEVTIAAALMAVVMVGAYGFWRFFTQNMNYSFAQSSAVEDANRIAGQIVREIREMKESEIGAYPLVTTGDQELAYYADPDADGRIEKVRYVLQNGQLKRGVIEPSGSPVTYPQESESLKIVTTHVANGPEPIFNYYNGNWPADLLNNPLALSNRPLQTRLIAIHLVIAVDSVEGTAAATVDKATTLRTLKTN